jgi:hypothetical protein
MKKNIVLILILFLTSCSLFKPSNELSNRYKLKVLKSKLNLTNLEYKTLKNDELIINEAYKTLIDTVEVSKINNRLDSFFAKKYSRRKTQAALILERIHKGRVGSFQFTGEDTKDTLKPITPEIERQLRQYFLEMDKSLKKTGGQWVSDTVMINSRRRNEPDSIRKIKIRKFFKRKDSMRIEKLKLEKTKKYDDGVEKYNKTRDSL